MLRCPARCIGSRAPGHGELPVLPVPAGTGRVPALQLRPVPPAVPEVHDPQGRAPSGKLAEDQLDNPAGFPGIEPLEIIGKPGDRDWMGLEWTGPEPLAPEHTAGVPASAGLYLLSEAGSQEIVYIGLSADVAKRLAGSGRKMREGRALQFSYQIIGQSVVPHNLRELEADLIGNYFENFRKASEFQFKNTTGSSESG